MRSRRWMGIRRSPLPQKASKIEAGAIAADSCLSLLFHPPPLSPPLAIAARRAKNRRNNYRANDGRGVQYAILSGATVLIIASEAITSRRGKIPRRDHGRMAGVGPDRVIPGLDDAFLRIRNAAGFLRLPSFGPERPAD